MKKSVNTQAVKKKPITATKKSLTRAEWIKLFVDRHKNALTTLAHK